MKRTGIVPLLILATFVAALADVRVLNVSVWPEYDHPGLLVIINGEFTEDTSFPAELTFNLPENVHAVLTMGTHEKADSTIQFKVEGTSVTVPFVQRLFQVEYYNRVMSEDEHRDFSVQIDPQFSVLEHVTLYIQKPLAAQNFKMDFDYESVETDPHGMNIYRKDLGTMKAGDTFTATVHYDNPGMQMSIEKLREMMGGNSETSSAEPEMINPGKNHLAWWLISGFAAAALIILLIFRKGDTEQLLSPKKTVFAQKITSKKYCTSCGGEILPVYKYCPWCGTKLK